MPEEVMESDPGETVAPASESAPSFEDLLTENMREFGGAVEDDDFDSDVVELEEDATTEDLDAGDDEVDDLEETDEESISKPGIDKILTHLDSEMPGAAGVVRGMQSETNRVINEFNDLKSQMLDVMVEMRQNGAADDDMGVDEVDEEPDEYDPSETQLKLIERAAEKLGFVRKEEVAAEKAETESRSYVDDAMKEGVEKHGKAFGTINEEGEVVLNPTIQAKLRPVRDRLASKGFTPLDLAVLSGVLTPEQAEAQRGEEAEAAPKTRTRPRRAGRANVADGSVGASNTRPSIRSKNPESDDPDDVFNRAFALGRKQLRRNQR